MSSSLKNFLEREGWPFCYLCSLVYVAFLIQLVGIASTDQNLNPIIRPAPPAWRFLGEVGLDLSTLAPLLGIFSIYVVRSPFTYEAVPARRRFVWGMALASVLLAFAEFYWSWSGHPTWLRGFVG